MSVALPFRGNTMKQTLRKQDVNPNEKGRPVGGL